MTRRKLNPTERWAAEGQLSFTKQMEGNLDILERHPAVALDWWPDDEELRRAVEAGDLVLVVARAMELYIVRTQQEASAAAASRARADRTRRRNKDDAAATRAAALRKLDRLLAAKDRTLAEALRDGWSDPSQRDRVRRWAKERDAKR